MPPRHSKDTPQSAVSGRRSPPAAPARRVTRATRSAASSNQPVTNQVSPDVVSKKAADSDEVFRSGTGGRGSLKYDGKGTNKPVRKPSGVEEEEVSPTPGPSKKNLKPVRAEKVAGKRRVPPSPIKRKPGASSSRSRGRRVASQQQSSDSDVEIVEDVPATPDEGYESAEDDGVVPKEEPEDQDMNWPASEDEVDEDGNLKDFIQDEAEEGDDEEEEDGMDVDDEGGHAEDGDEKDSSPMPVKISKPKRAITNKRGAVNLSDDEDMPLARKRRTSDGKNAEKTIQATGLNSKVTLKMRKTGENDEDLRTIKKTIQRAPKKQAVVVVQGKNNKAAAVKGKKEVNAVGTKNVKTAPTKGKGKQKVLEEEEEEEEEEQEEDEGREEEEEGEEECQDVEPQDAGCEVTDPEKQCTLLMGLYTNLPALKGCIFALTNVVQMANLDVLTDKEQFSEDMDLGRIQDIITTISIPTAFISNPARDDPKHLVLKTYGTGQGVCMKGAPAGELADIIFYGFVTHSCLVEGRGYKKGDTNGKSWLKELQMLLLQQEGDRALALLSMVVGKVVELATTADGAVSFTTKHTLVDEDGNPEQKKANLSKSFLAKTSRAVPRNAVHQDIQRRAREGTDRVPVFNSTANFISKPNQPGYKRLQAEEVLTQRAKVDPPYNHEIPQGAFVAVHSTVTTFNIKGVKKVSFNLLAVQVLALPTA